MPSETSRSTRAVTSSGSCSSAPSADARHERALGRVAAVDEELPHRPQPRLLRRPQERRAGQAEHRQLRGVVADGRDDRGRLRLVVHDRVVQRAVRLDVAHRRPGHPAHPVQRADLVDDVVGELVRRDVDEPPAEPGEVAVPDLGPDHHPRLGGERAGAAQRRRVAGVEPARDVRRRHEPEHRLVVAEHPAAERLAEVGVEVERVHRCTGSSCRSVRAVSGASFSAISVRTIIAARYNDTAKALPNAPARRSRPSGRSRRRACRRSGSPSTRRCSAARSRTSRR